MAEFEALDEGAAILQLSEFVELIVVEWLNPKLGVDGNDAEPIDEDRVSDAVRNDEALIDLESQIRVMLLDRLALSKLRDLPRVVDIDADSDGDNALFDPMTVVEWFLDGVGLCRVTVWFTVWLILVEDHSNVSEDVVDGTVVFDGLGDKAVVVTGTINVELHDSDVGCRLIVRLGASLEVTDRDCVHEVFPVREAVGRVTLSSADVFE